MNEVLMLPPGKTDYDLDVGGAGRGATSSLPVFARAGTMQTGDLPRVRVADPQLGKALQLAERGQEVGLAGVPLQARIEDIVAREAWASWPLSLHLDRARALSEVAMTVGNNGARRPVLAQFFLRLADGTVMSALVAIPRGDDRGLESFAQFTAAIDRVTLPTPYARFFDPTTGAVPLGLEGLHRDIQRQHLEASLPRLAADLDAERAPFELYLDGRVIPAAVVPSPAPVGWAPPARLAQRVADETLLVERGSDFGVVELGRDGIKVHVARSRSDRAEIEHLNARDIGPDPRDTERVLRDAWVAVATRRAPLLMTE